MSFKGRTTALACLLTGCLVLPAGADTLLIESVRQAERAVEDAPERGITMERVESRYGSPEEQHSAVGDPPITRWDYGAFSVYFEDDRVIRAVRQP